MQEDYAIRLSRLTASEQKTDTVTDTQTTTADTSIAKQSS